ncbi:hypothetical protein Nizo2814_2527 [Lactiplantibacillus plantarum]|nr:hypothetical protein Nizo2814_2527 [Lactiplantibacillus plantarum]
MNIKRIIFKLVITNSGIDVESDIPTMDLNGIHLYIYF